MKEKIKRILIDSFNLFKSNINTHTCGNCKYYERSGFSEGWCEANGFTRVKKDSTPEDLPFICDCFERITISEKQAKIKEYCDLFDRTEVIILKSELLNTIIYPKNSYIMLKPKKSSTRWRNKSDPLDC